jgi:hypothetical protein
VSKNRHDGEFASAALLFRTPCSRPVFSPRVSLFVGLPATQTPYWSSPTTGGCLWPTTGAF